MSAEKLLEYHSFFSGGEYNIDEIALEYLDLCKKYDTDLFFARSHLFKLFFTANKIR